MRMRGTPWPWPVPACAVHAHVRGKFQRLPLDFKAVSIRPNEASWALDDVIGLIKLAPRRCDGLDSP